MKPVLDCGYVKLDYISADAITLIARAARMSTTKESKGAEQDLKLVKYLKEHKHTSPFEMVQMRWIVKAPIFVARQWMRHRTGSFNEKSLRYTEETEMQFYHPDAWRLQDTKNKQSSGGYVSNGDLCEREYTRALVQCVDAYHTLLDSGVAREQARMVLPVSLYTEFMWGVNLHNFWHFIGLRNKPDAQYEIRVYAQAMLDLLPEELSCL